VSAPSRTGLGALKSGGQAAAPGVSIVRSLRGSWTSRVSRCAGRAGAAIAATASAGTWVRERFTGRPSRCGGRGAGAGAWRSPRRWSA
jgi:hypothetical protein